MGIELNDVVFDLTSGPPSIPALNGLARWDPVTGTLYVADGTVWLDITGATPAPVTPVRTKLTTTTDFYVNDATGSDANDGLTPGTAWQTLAFAANELSTQYDLGGQTVNLNIADGTYDEGGTTSIGGTVGGGFLNIVGNTLDASTVLIRYPSFSLGLSAQNTTTEITLRGVTLGPQPAATPLFLVSSSDGHLNLRDVRLDVTGVFAAAISYAQSSNGVTQGDITVLGSGTSPSVFLISGHADLTIGSNTIDFSTAITVSTAVVDIRGTSLINFTGTTFNNGGNVTGKRFTAVENSHVQTGTNDLTFIPGTIAGTIETGSSYDIYPTLRERLTADRTYYVNSGTGSDTNDGLTPGTAWQTLQKASEVLSKEIDYRGYDITLDIADGTYLGPLTIYRGVGHEDITTTNNGRRVFIVGDVVFKNVIIEVPLNSVGVLVSGTLCEVDIRGITFTRQGAAASIQYGVLVTSYARAAVRDCRFSVLPSANVFAAFDHAYVENNSSNELNMDVADGVFSSLMRLSTHSHGSSGGNLIIPNLIAATVTTLYDITNFSYAEANEVLVEFGTGTLTTTNKAILDTHSDISRVGATTPNDLTGNGAAIFQDSSCSFNGNLQSIRERLTADRTYYVDPAGSDTNDGLTVGTPFQTIQKACDVVFQDSDVLGFSTVIQLADGTYPDPSPAFTVRGHVNIGGMGAQHTINRNAAYNGVEIRGNTANPQNVIIEINDCNYGFYIDGHTSNLWINGMTFTRAGGAASVAGAITVNDQSKIYASNLRFDEIITGSCIELFASSHAICFGTFELTMDNAVGNYFTLFYAQRSLFDLSITFTTPPAIDVSFTSNVGLIYLFDSAHISDTFSTWTPGAGATFPTRPFGLSENSSILYFPSAVDLTRYPGDDTLIEVDPTSSYNRYTINNYTNTEALTGAKTLYRYRDSVHQEFSVTTDQAITLDTGAAANSTVAVNNHYIIINDPTSTGNLIINGGIATITPGTQGGFVFNGTTWRVI